MGFETANGTESVESYELRVAQAVRDGLIEGNLLLPQTYDAIAVCGAKAFLEQMSL